MGIKMSEFYHGKYRDVNFVAYPLGIRKFIFFRYLPYWTAQRVGLIIKINSCSGKNLIYDIPIAIKYLSEQNYSLLVENENCILNENKTEATITTPRLYGGDCLEYHLGAPRFNDSVKAVQLQANWKGIILSAFFSIIGSVLLVILGWILGFIQIVFK